MKTADVFVNIPVKSIAQAYTYRVPEHLSQIAAGWRVFVPFGNRRVEGFVIRTHENAQAPEGIALKDIIAAVDEESWFSPQMIEVARWLADFTCVRWPKSCDCSCRAKAVCASPCSTRPMLR